MEEKVKGKTILVADDEPEIRDLMRLYLEKEGYLVLEAEDGSKAASLFESRKIDLAVLDIMMPGLDGFHLLKKIRETSNIPVLILSARTADTDKILGLGLGADDYISKPFNPLEAVARIQANLRRYSDGTTILQKSEYVIGDLRLNLDSCSLTKGDMDIELTSVEFRIMKLFMENPSKVFTKQQIYEAGWGEDFPVSDNSIMVCISKLRGKLSSDADEYIRTIRGLGYRLESKK